MRASRGQIVGDHRHLGDVGIMGPQEITGIMGITGIRAQRCGRCPQEPGEVGPGCRCSPRRPYCCLGPPPPASSPGDAPGVLRRGHRTGASKASRSTSIRGQEHQCHHRRVSHLLQLRGEVAAHTSLHRVCPGEPASTHRSEEEDPPTPATPMTLSASLQWRPRVLANESLRRPYSADLTPTQAGPCRSSCGHTTDSHHHKGHVTWHHRGVCCGPG